jgi:hypothetical protein
MGVFEEENMGERPAMGMVVKLTLKGLFSSNTDS